MNTALTPAKAADIMEAVIIKGDLAALTPEQRAKYYVRVCESMGLNPMTRPLEYITLNGKLTLYARKDCTDQLRQLHKIAVTAMTESERDGVFIVTAQVANADGRTDIAKGAVFIDGLKGEHLANAMMKAETKAKRRATLSICGLGFLDETEVDDVRGAARGETPPAPIDGPPPPDQISAPEAPTQPSAEADEPIDEREWLRELDGAFAGTEDLASVGDVQRDVMAPMKDKVSREAWAEAVQIATAAYQRVMREAEVA